MAITWPTGCDTPRRKLEFCVNAREKLRKLHNRMGYWYNSANPDVTVNQWNKLPAKIRNRYPFAPKLTKAQWNDFRENVFEVINDKINHAISDNQQLIANSSEYTPDLEMIHGGL